MSTCTSNVALHREHNVTGWCLHTHTLQEAGSIVVGPFLVSPKEFSISEGGCTELQVLFTPPGIGSFTEDLDIACDNGQVLTYTLSGAAVHTYTLSLPPH